MESSAGSIGVAQTTDVLGLLLLMFGDYIRKRGTVYVLLLK